MRSKLETALIEMLEDEEKSSQELYEELKYSFRNKVYGNRDEELAFFKTFFSLFYEKQYEVFEIEWLQYQDYNDNWYYFDIKSVRVNQYLDHHFTGFDDADEKAWKYVFMTSLSEITDFDERKKAFAKLEKENQGLRKHIDKVFVFLRALYDYYGSYYFIYVFGDRAKVTISKDGMTIDNENVESD